MDKKIPFRRNWLEEAYKIFRGDSTIKVKKEHVEAAMDALVGFSKDAEKLRSLLMQAYQQSCEIRKAKGLPVPPPPPGLDQPGPKLPW